MLSTHSAYMRGISPPKYRRQTLEIFDIYNSNSHKTDFTHLPPRPVSALDRKWVHRSLGDLTSDQEYINSHPRLQTDFYQELFQKYPQAFMRRRNAREAGRKLFNSRLHVRFEDEEKPLEQRSRSDMNLHRTNHQLTNWDREVGPYMRKNSRECFTSAEQSECSGSVLSLKQRLHINSVTLHKLLHEKSPLRKKFERDRAADDSGTENEQTLEEYFLDKSRQRSRNRVKHRRVLQRRIRSNTNNKEEEKTTAHRRWISKSASPTRRNMYSLPIHHDKSNSGHSHENIDSVIKDTDLKIDTLLEKISSKLSGLESPPDSAIDIDTPSVQSFVSSDKVINSDNVYQVSIDLLADDKEGDFDSQSSPESSPSMCNNKSGRTSSESTIEGKSAICTKAVISLDNQTSLCNYKHDTDVQHTDNENSIEKAASLKGPGLLQLYMNQHKPKTSDTKLQTVSNSYTDQSDLGKIITTPETSDKRFVNDPEMLSCERECNNKTDVTNAFIEKCNQGMIAVTGTEVNITSSLPPCGREMQREDDSTSIQPTDKIVPNRFDTDTNILDEIQLEDMSHDLDGRHSSLDNVDDTDLRLGIPKVSVHEARIAEKYRRTRSPSPFIVKKHKAASRDRPSSAPVLRTEVDITEMKIIDIPLTVDSDNSEPVNTSNTPVKHNSKSDNDSCQHDDIQRESFYDIIPNGQSKLDAKKKSCVQITDSKILVSSSQIKQRNNPNAIETVDAEIHHSYTENGISLEDIAKAVKGELTNENSDKNKHSDPTENNNQGQQERFYKPSATSPRLNEKRVRLKNLLKSKKDSYSHAPPDVITQEDHMAKINVEKPQQNFSACEDAKFQHHDSNHSEANIDGSSSKTPSVTDMVNDPQETLRDTNTIIQEDGNTLIERLQDSDTESAVQTVKSKSDIKHGHSQVNVPSAGIKNISTSHESLPPSGNVPPVKPARTKHKKLLPNIGLSQDRIMPNGRENVVYLDSSQKGNAADMRHSSFKSEERDAKRLNLNNFKDPDDKIEVMPDPYASNLERSKDISASKTSLFGGFKSATKGKFKTLKKAMSLDKGIDKAGAVSFPDPNIQTNQGGDNNVESQKMKKAPSLKSITSLFRRKKKKGKLTFADTQSSSTPGSCLSLSNDPTGSAGNQRPAPSVVKHVAGSQPVGKLQALNPDGTQLIQLTKPKNGPIGFFIAKGSARYKNGIFISRFADSQPERVFGGLLSVGDEILEVNGQFVRDLSQDDVYNIISASPILVMKIFPFIARKDV